MSGALIQGQDANLTPLFQIISRMFERTRSTYSRWLFDVIGTVFSLAVLTVVVSLTTKVVEAIAFAFISRVNGQ